MPRSKTTSVTQRKTATRRHASPTKRPTTDEPADESPSKRRSRVSQSSAAVYTKDLRNDRLGTLVRELCNAYDHASSWEEFVTTFRGRSYLSPGLDSVDHPAVPLLKRWRDEGVPAQVKGDPWTPEQRDACVQRGCHKSATEHTNFLREEMADFISNKFWMVLPYELLRSNDDLYLSPAAVKEERERRPRLISDHSFDWGWSPVNDLTLPHAPPEAMQFGGTLPRILRHIRHANPKFGPPRLCKHDIKDGFYRMFLRPADCLHLSLVLPRIPGEPQLIAIPMACTMGWVQSPPTFSAMSETICDHASSSFQASPTQVRPHRLEPVASLHDDLDPSWEPRPREPDTTAADSLLRTAPGASASTHLDLDIPSPPTNQPWSRPLAENDVFVDDFIQLAQGGPRRMKTFRQHLFHAIDDILSQPDASETHRNEAVSLKKALKGDSSWSTRKVILGWIIDTVRQTIELPAHRKETLAAIFAALANSHRVSNKDYLSYLGKLRFVSVAIPGSKGLFSALQLAHSKAKGNRVRINRLLRQHINAFASLCTSLSQRPTHLAEIVPQQPSLVGATDAAKPGMGGIFYDPQGRPFVWRAPFCAQVQKTLVSADNPKGSTTNSDLEYAALLAQLDLMASVTPVTYATIHNKCDNTPAVSRVRKGAVNAEGPAALLCDWACLHQRQHRYCHLASYLPGELNVMADDASRLQHLTDAAFLAHFQQHYPQHAPWTLLHLKPETNSQLTSALLSHSAPETLSRRPPTPTPESSDYGVTSWPNLDGPLPSLRSAAMKTSSPTSSSSPSATAATVKPTDLSALVQWTKPSWPWARGSPTWVNSIPAKNLEDPNTSIQYTALSSSGSKTKTTRPPESTPPMSPSSAPCTTAWTLTMQSKESPTKSPSTSASSASTGCSGPLNTCRPPLLKPVHKPSACVTSTSASTAMSTPATRRL